MPQITFSCPDCSGLLQATFDESHVEIQCLECHANRDLPSPDMSGGYLQKCMACPSTELFVRKDFPQRLGVTIVVIGFAVSSYFWAYHNVMIPTPHFVVVAVMSNRPIIVGRLPKRRPV